MSSSSMWPLVLRVADNAPCPPSCPLPNDSKMFILQRHYSRFTISLVSPPQSTCTKDTYSGWYLKHWHTQSWSLVLVLQLSVFDVWVVSCGFEVQVKNFPFFAKICPPTERRGPTYECNRGFRLLIIYYIILWSKVLRAFIWYCTLIKHVMLCYVNCTT